MVKITVRTLLLLFVLLLSACGQQPASTPTTTTSTTQPAAPSTTAPISETVASAPADVLHGEITVFAAASLTESYTELGALFEATYPGTSVTFNFGGSQQLVQQLEQGAPADVFASANTKQMGAAIEAGRVVSGTQQVFAHNRLIAIVSTNSPVQVNALEDLATPDLKIVLAAKDVPVGGYALDFLDKAAADNAYGPDYKTQVLNNVVSYEQTVKAVLTKVVLGEGDAGIVYSSDVTSDTARSVTTIAIPDALNTIATYPIAVVSDSANPPMAQAFIALILSPEGQAILAKHGFLPVVSEQ